MNIWSLLANAQEAAVGNFQLGMLVKTHDDSFWGKVVRVNCPAQGVETAMVCWLDPFKDNSRVRKDEVDHIVIIPDQNTGIKYEEVNGNLRLCKFTCPSKSKINNL